MHRSFLLSDTKTPSRVLSSPMPFVLVFQDAFVDTNPTVAFTTVVLSLIIIVAVSSLAATSRLVYAFA
jgi:amino acid permease